VGFPPVFQTTVLKEDTDDKINFDFGKPSAGGIVDLSNATVRVIPTGWFRDGSRRGLTHGGADVAA
jgi:hypothetical protein